MKLMRLALCVAVFALVGGIAFSEDMDIRALQAKLAAQEARLNDLQAKMNTKSGAGTADNVVSLRKNAKVTIGGDFNTRMYESWGKVKSSLTDTSTTNRTGWEYGGGSKSKIEEVRANDFRVADAKLRVKVDVNDYFEAFFRFDMQDDRDVTQATQEAYIRWKNVCNSGFSLLVGRTEVVFGGGNEAGSNYSGFYGGTSNENGDPNFSSLASRYGYRVGNDDLIEPFFANGNGALAPAHMGWDQSRTTQVTGSWENPDGTFKAELSYIQGLEYGGAKSRFDTNDKRKSINDGFGSGSARVTWTGIEGLKLSASAINMYNNVKDNGIPSWLTQKSAYIPGTAGMGASSHTAVNLHAAYRPAFFSRLKVWAAWTHDWNAGWVKDLDANMLHWGASYDLTERFTIFGIGEWMKHDWDSNNAQTFKKSEAWAAYAGVKGVIGYGVDWELGYRYEDYEYKDRSGNKHTDAYSHTVYARLNFNF